VAAQDNLTPKETKLLARLREGAGQPVSRLALARGVWGTDQPGARTVEMAVTRLRRKLTGGGWTITTVRGVGYRLARDVPEGAASADDSAEAAPGRSPIRGGWIDLEQYTVHRHGVTVALTPREVSVLEVLAKEPGRPVDRDDLRDRGLGESSSAAALRAVLHRLRKKIEEDPAAPIHLVDVKGLGTGFLPPGPSEDRVLPLRGVALAQHGDLGTAELLIRQALAARAAGEVADDATSAMWLDLVWILIERRELSEARRALRRGRAAAEQASAGGMLARLGLEVVAGRDRAALWWKQRIGRGGGARARTLAALYAVIAAARVGDRGAAERWRDEMQHVGGSLEIESMPTLLRLAETYCALGTGRFGERRAETLRALREDRAAARSRDARIVRRLLVEERGPRSLGPRADLPRW